MKRLLGIPLLVLAAAAPARAQAPSAPFFQNPIGPMVDVTDRWQDYQPASDFCIKPDVVQPTDQLVGAIDAEANQWPTNSDASDPVCADALAHGLIPADSQPPFYHGHIDYTGLGLCAGCRRIFFDYSQIPANDPANFLFYAHGHAYFRTSSFNPSYTVDPLAHSPNIKNFTNDKLIAPYGSPQESIANAIDLHDMSYVGDTAHYVHNGVQGPYYVGPKYFHCDANGCVAINGAYVDVDVADYPPLPNPNLDAIHYEAGFNSGEATCPDNEFPPYGDGDILYGGCTDHFGFSDPNHPIDPFADGR